MYTCPVTSQIKSFNKYPDQYFLIPDIISNDEKKISFAKLDSIRPYSLKETHEARFRLTEQSFQLLKERINDFNSRNKEEYDQIKLLMYYNNLLSSNEKINVINKVKARIKNNKKN